MERMHFWVLLFLSFSPLVQYAIEPWDQLISNPNSSGEFYESTEIRPAYSLHTLYLVNNSLNYLKRSSLGTWTSQYVENSRPVFQAAIDLLGQVAHISYAANSTSSYGVRYANNTTGSFQNYLSVPNTITYGFDENAIAVDATGVVHISHNAKPSSSTQAQRETFGTLNSWTNPLLSILTDPIEANADFTGSSIYFSNGRIIMQGNPRRSNSPVAINVKNPNWATTVALLTNAGSNTCTAGAWGGEAKLSMWGEGHSVYHCVAAGSPMITHIGYAQNESGAWITSSLAQGPGALPSPSRPVTFIDKTDTLHLVYEQGGLKYQYRPRKGTWSKVVSLPSGTGTSSHVVAADSISSVDIVYVSNNTLKHLSNASGAWVSKDIITLSTPPKLQKGMKLAY